MPLRFLDTNILVRYFARDDEQKARRALALLQRLERGEERVRSSLIVIFETVYTLQSHFRMPKVRIQDLLVPVIELRGLELPNKGRLLRTLDLYVGENISFADAHHAVEMRDRGEREIYTWDADFDKVAGLQRIEPDGEPA